MIQKMKRQGGGRKYLQNTHLIKNLCPKFKELSQLSNKKKKQFKQEEGRDVKDIPIAKKHMKKCLTHHLVIRGMQNKIIVSSRYHWIAIGLAISF